MLDKNVRKAFAVGKVKFKQCSNFEQSNTTWIIPDFVRNHSEVSVSVPVMVYLRSIMNYLLWQMKQKNYTLYARETKLAYDWLNCWPIISRSSCLWDEIWAFCFLLSQQVAILGTWYIHGTLFYFLKFVVCLLIYIENRLLLFHLLSEFQSYLAISALFPIKTSLKPKDIFFKYTIYIHLSIYVQTHLDVNPNT